MKWWNQFKQKIKLMDWPSLWLMGLFILVGYIFIYSATLFEFSDGLSISNAQSYVKRQVFTTVVGLVVGVSFLVLPEKWIKNKMLIWVFNIGVILLLIITNLFGNTVGGSTNWLSIASFSFQPSELVKISMPLLFAWYWAFEGDYSLSSLWQWGKTLIQHVKGKVRDRNNANKTKGKVEQQNQAPDKEIRLEGGQTKENRPLSLKISHLTTGIESDWPFLIGALCVTVLSLAMMPDYGMILVLVSTLGMVYMYIHYSIKQNLILFGIGSLLYIVFIQFASVFSGNYIFDRVRVASNPFLEPQGSGYQLVRALLAISSGGLWGQGVLKGPIKAQSLPASHTDFIFAVMGEEVGMIGLAVFLGFYLYFILRLMRNANRLSDPFRRYIAITFPFILLIQAMINIGGVLSLIPLTGLTLPFVSYGGTSMMVMTLYMGIYQYMVVTDQLDLSHDLSEIHYTMVQDKE